MLLICYSKLSSFNSIICIAIKYGRKLVMISFISLAALCNIIPITFWVIYPSMIISYSVLLTLIGLFSSFNICL